MGGALPLAVTPKGTKEIALEEVMAGVDEEVLDSGSCRGFETGRGLMRWLRSRCSPRLTAFRGGVLATNRRVSPGVAIQAPKPMPCLPHILILCMGAQALGVAADVAPSIHALFRSSDRGRTWTRSDAGLQGTARINALAASSHRHYAGTDAGVFVSDDSGVTWREGTVIPGPSRRVLDLIVRDGTLYAGTDGGGLLRSDDNARTWERVDVGRGSRRVRSLTQADGALFAGLDSGGVLRSSNGGRTWVALDEGLPKGAQVFDLAEMGGAVFAGLYSKGLYRLDGPEGRWRRTGEVLPLALVAVGDTLVAGHNPGGIFWSSDQGQSWRATTGDLPTEAPVWAMGGDRELVLAGVSDGIYRSENKGRSWSRAEGGLPPICPGIAFLVSEPLILAAVIIRE